MADETKRWLQRIADRLASSPVDLPDVRIEIDERGVRRMQGEAVVEGVDWDALVKVSIITTDAGPLFEDFFWVLHAEDGSGCVVPNQHAYELKLLERLQRLAGFDHEAVIAASGSTAGAQLLCWEGAPGEASAAAEPPAG